MPGWSSVGQGHCRPAFCSRSWRMPAYCGVTPAASTMIAAGESNLPGRQAVVAGALQGGRRRARSAMISPVGAGLARRLHGLAHQLHPPLRVAEGAVLLGAGRAGQDDIGQSSLVSVRKMSWTTRKSRLRRAASDVVEVRIGMGFSPMMYMALSFPSGAAFINSTRVSPGLFGSGNAPGLLDLGLTLVGDLLVAGEDVG